MPLMAKTLNLVEHPVEDVVSRSRRQNGHQSPSHFAKLYVSGLLVQRQRSGTA